MKNSNEMCQPLCMPFVCFGFDSRYSAFPEKPYMHYFAELLLVREGRLRVLRNQEEQIVSPGEGTITGVVTSVIFKGVHYEMDILAHNYHWTAHSTKMAPEGETVGIRIDPFNIQVMNKPVREDQETLANE